MRRVLNRLRGWFRLAMFFFYTLFWTSFLLLADKVGHLHDGNRLIYRERYSRGMAWLLGFRFTLDVNLPDIGGPYLFVGNHRSTLDPLLAFYSIRAWPLSRLWIKNWPLVGKGSQVTGIIFVDKKSRDSRRLAKERIYQELCKGNSILVYAEGHTNVEPYTVTFHKGSFEQAARGPFPVIPFILEYRDVTDYWDHSENFVQHFVRAFGKQRHFVHLQTGPVLKSENAWTLLRQSRQWIDTAMADIHKKWGNTQYENALPRYKLSDDHAQENAQSRPA